jgi:osmotically-inducible protein OsmY
VFLRPDGEIADDVADVLSGVLLADRSSFSVSVTEGLVTLTGTLPQQDLIPVAIRLASEVEGVVSVTSTLAVAAPAA